MFPDCDMVVFKHPVKASVFAVVAFVFAVVASVLVFINPLAVVMSYILQHVLTVLEGIWFCNIISAFCLSVILSCCNKEFEMRILDSVVIASCLSVILSQDNTKFGMTFDDTYILLSLLHVMKYWH
jgi:hypothetical protein